MSEEIKNEVIQTLEETAPVEQVKEAPKESHADKNFKALREEKDRLAREREQMQRERDEAMRYAQMAMQNQQRQQQPAEPEPLDTDVVEYGHVRKTIKALKDEINTIKQESQIGIIEAQLKAKYSDFDSVVSKANLDQLQEQYPDIHKTIYTSQDLYAKGSTAYQLIKKFVSEPAEAPRASLSEQKQLQQNMAKPKSLNTVNASQPETPLDRARLYSEGLTEDMKKQIYEHMNTYATKKDIKWTPTR
jgi:hypothetical protein